VNRIAHRDDREPSADALDLLRCAERAESVVEEQLERALYGDARDFLARPGKAFRARLIEACYALADGATDGLPRAALEAVELLHGGSLIIDDIQDDAELRRGAPALHRLIGTPRAINSGNWLYFVALARLDELPLDARRARTLTRAAHECLMRCHEGQALDLALRVDELRRADIAALARITSALKTGALTGFAAALGGTLAGGSAEALDALTQFGQRVGIALQMLDDLSGLVREDRKDKALEDLRGRRVSWGWAWASELLDELSFKQLVRQLAREGELGAVRLRLSESVQAIGREHVARTLDEARCELARAFAPSHAREALHAELSRLEQSYG